MDALIIKHVDVEGPGLVGDYLEQSGIDYQILLLKTGVRLPRLDDLRRIVFLGGPMNVDEEDRYPFLREEDLFIKEAIQRGKPVLGICLGAQLIAKALGAKVLKAPVKEIGWYDVSLTEEGSKDLLFSHFPKTFSVFQWHEDTFEIPRGGKLIATSGMVPHQAYRYGENTYGLQFHLEVTKEMIQEWVKTYDEECEDASTPPPSSRGEILAKTEKEIEPYQKRGIDFLKHFFKNTQ